MRRHMIGLATVAAALTFAGVAAAGTSTGATVVNDAGCTSNIFATTCIVVKSVTNMTVTPSGNISYVTNGTVERHMTFVFGGTYTYTDSLHLHSLRKDDVLQEEGDHFSSQTVYASGTYQLTCVQSYDIHWANDKPQPSNYELSCV
jgi:hypothetical protein